MDISTVETVALWAGLFSGVASIVLAIVAIVFTFAVDRRSSAINEQMIKSLQKIESTVESVASDTTGLIKVAWERLLPGGDVSEPTPVTTGEEDDSVRAIINGVTSELRADLASGGTVDQATMDRLDEAVRRLEASMGAQLAASEVSNRPTSRVESLQSRLSKLPPSALALVHELARSRHLTREEYGRLREDSPLRRQLVELRNLALLVPLSGVDSEGQDIPVYWFDPRDSEFIQPILSLLAPPPRSARARVRAALQAVGYPVAGESD